MLDNNLVITDTTFNQRNDVSYKSNDPLFELTIDVYCSPSVFSYRIINRWVVKWQLRITADRF